MEEGARSAILVLLGLVVLPIFLINIGVNLLGYRTLPQALEISLALQQMIPWIAVFGGMGAFLVFVASSLPQRSMVRLGLGLAFVAVQIVLLYAVLLLTDLSHALAVNGLSLPMDVIFILGAVLLGFRIVRPLGELAEAGRKVVPQAQARNAGVREDFRLRHGTFTKGVNSAQLALATFVVVPIIILLVLDAMINAKILGGVVLPLSVGEYLTILLGLGLPAAWCAFFIGFYPSGSVSRALFGVAVSGLAAIWVISLTSGGRMTVNHSMGLMQISYTGIIVVIVIATLAWIGYFVLDMYLNRAEYLRNGRRTPNEERRKSMRELERAKEKAARRKRKSG
ncbi:MAG: hypothetical protein WCK39_09525, partial [Methanomassiliicoccales archaeon]